jgi:hypothetical protein
MERVLAVTTHWVNMLAVDGPPVFSSLSIFKFIQAAS